MIYQKGTPEQKASFMNRLFWLGLFIALFLLCACFVSTHDDYYIPEMGNSFLGSLQFAATMGNGRYIGNFLGNFLSQRTAANVIIKSLALWLIIRLTAALFSGQKGLTFFSAALILWPGTGIFAQDYNWSHGFYNYVMPVVFVLAELKLAENAGQKKQACAGAILCAFCAMLFSENTTVIGELINMAFLGWQMWKQPEQRKTDLLILLSALLGAAVMFLLPKLTGVAANMEGYRGTVTFGDISALVYGIKENAVNIMRTVSEWHLFWLGLLFALWLPVMGHKKRKVPMAGLLLLTVCAAAMTLIHACLNEDEIPHMTALFTALFIVTVILTIWLVCRSFSGAVLKRAAWPFLFALLSAGELLLVFPIGPRCLYITYIMMMFSLLVLWQAEAEELSDRAQARLRTGSFCVLCAAWVVLMAAMIPLQLQNRARISYIKEQMDAGKTEVEVIALPENGLLYWPNVSEQWGYTFNYGIPGDITFTLIPTE